MHLKKILRTTTVTTVAIAIGMLCYLLEESRAFSYLSNESAVCINCHVMDGYYASWQHSSHAQRASCVDCHLPAQNYIDKYMAKSRDGFNHSLAFTLTTYSRRMLITEDGARRVQQNCIRCHAAFSKTSVKNTDRYHAFTSESLGGRKCWDCHRRIPHGKVRSINGSPDNLGVKWNR